jgi:hypothetical protein
MEFELPNDFREFFESLNSNNVRYLLIGGYAVGIYGYTRATNDLDVFVSGDRQNVENLIHALNEFGFSDSGLSVESFAQKRSMIEMGVEPIKIQILNFADGIDFETAYSNRNSVEIENILIDTIDKKDLIANKLASGRLKDLADVERLQKTT